MAAAISARDALANASGTDLRRQVAVHVTKFSIGSFIGGIGTLLNNYMGALFLGPSLWGVWQGAVLPYRFGQMANFGVLDGLSRELPLQRGSGKNDEKSLVDAAFTVSVGTACISAVFVAAAALMLPISLPWRSGLLCVAILLLLFHVGGFYEVLLRSVHDFTAMSRLAVLRGLGLVIGIGLVVVLGLEGFLISQVVAMGVTTSYAWWRSPFKPSLRLPTTQLRRLVATGFPIMLMVAAVLVMTMADRMLILGFLGEGELAMYSLGVLVFAPFQMLFSASDAVLFPRLAERYGASGSNRGLLNLLVEPTEKLGVAVAFGVGVAATLLPLAVPWLLPEYAGGVPAAQLLLFGLSLYYLTGMGNNLMVAVGRQWTRFGLVAASGLVTVASIAAVLQAGLGIVGVAGAAAACYAAFFATSTAIACREAQATSAEALRLLGATLVPVAISAAIALGMPLGLSQYGLDTATMALATLSVLAAVFAMPLARLAAEALSMLRSSPA